MIYRGRVKNGTITLEAAVELPDGIEVSVYVDDGDRQVSPMPALEDDPLYRMTEFAVETGIPDLATNSDHYLYERKPIWEVIAEIGAALPEEAWDDVPTDLSKNLD